MAVVAGGMASWSRVRSFRVARLSPSDDQGDSTSQRGAGALPIADSEVDRRSDTLNPTASQDEAMGSFGGQPGVQALPSTTTWTGTDMIAETALANGAVCSKLVSL